MWPATLPARKAHAERAVVLPHAIFDRQLGSFAAVLQPSVSAQSRRSSRGLLRLGPMPSKNEVVACWSAGRLTSLHYRPIYKTWFRAMPMPNKHRSVFCCRHHRGGSSGLQAPPFLT